MNENENEYYDGGDKDIDIKELNKAAREELLNSLKERSENNVPKQESIPQKTEKIQSDNIASTSTSVSGEENPIVKFLNLKKEIDEIEKDMKSYSERDDSSDPQISIEQCFEELKKLKNTVRVVGSSENYIQLKKIIEKQKSGLSDSEKIKILQKKMSDNMNEYLLNIISVINKLKADNPKDYESIKYELYVTPETRKAKTINKIMEIKQSLNNIEKKIGEWDMESKKQTISDTVNELRKNIRLFDKEFQTEIKNRMQLLGKRLEEYQTENNDYYKGISKEKIIDLHSGFKDHKEVEEIINNTIAQMEKLKNGHEENAYISLKLKDLVDQQEKLSIEMDDSFDILINLKKNIRKNVEAMRKNIEVIKSKISGKKK